MVNVNQYMLICNLLPLVGGSRIVSTSVVFIVVILFSVRFINGSALHWPRARSNVVNDRGGETMYQGGAEQWCEQEHHHCDC